MTELFKLINAIWQAYGPVSGLFIVLIGTLGYIGYKLHTLDRAQIKKLENKIKEVERKVDQLHDKLLKVHEERLEDAKDYAERSEQNLQKVSDVLNALSKVRVG